jgi:hypothetical protein
MIVSSLVVVTDQISCKPFLSSCSLDETFHEDTYSICGISVELCGQAVKTHQNLH